MQVRAYHKDDFEQVLDCFYSNVPVYFDKSEAEVLRRYLKEELEEYFVVEINAKVIGSGGINYMGNQAVLSWDIVHDTYHSKGVGSVLTNYRLDVIQNKKLPWAIVRTSQMTKGFYKKFGFAVSEINKEFWAPNIDLYYMLKVF